MTLKSTNSSTGANRRNFLKQTLAATRHSPSRLRAVGYHAHCKPFIRPRNLAQPVEKIADPVLKALGQRQLKAKCPLKQGQARSKVDGNVPILKPWAACSAGLAPWLERGPSSGKEGKLRQRYCDLARAGIASGTDPASPDYMNFGTTSQSVVDTAFLVLAICRAPTELWTKFDHRAQGESGCSFEGDANGPSGRK